jgi:hypothetical protein
MSTFTALERDSYDKTLLEVKTHILGDCTFVDEAEGIFNAQTVSSVSLPVYKFCLKLTPKNYSVLKKETETALQLYGGTEPYVFVKPDNWNSMTFSQQDEYRFTDQYQKTGSIPVYNPQTQNYLVPMPIDYVLGSKETGLVYFNQLQPPKLNGYTDGEPLTGLECTVEANFKALDNGRVYLRAKAINIYCHN